MKKESMKKEILTKENCKRDLISWIRPEKILWWYYPLMVCPLIVFILINRLFVHLPEVTEMLIIFAALLLLGAVFFALYKVKLQKSKDKIRKADIRIVQDVLVNTIDHYCFKVATPGDGGLGDVLEFSRYGSFPLSRWNENRNMHDLFGKKYYKWSDLYSMSTDGVYNTSLVGDKFYLAIYADDPEQKPVMVYNAKFFEYNEHESNEKI